MEDKLKNLNENMNETVLRDVHFKEKNKQFVLKAIRKNSNPNLFIRYKRLFNMVLSGLVTCAVLISLAFFSGKQMGLFKEKPIQKSASKETTLYTPSKQDENYANMTKEEVFDKMLNSLDYFKTATGKFKQAGINDNGEENGGIVEYELSNQKPASGFSKESGFGNKYENQTKFIYIRNNKKWEIERMGYKEVNFDSPISSEKTTYTTDEEKRIHYILKKRDFPPIGTAQCSLFNFSLVYNSLSDFKYWNIDTQNETLLGHNTIVLKGTLEHSSFRFWVDKDTGILLKYETFDRFGKLESYLHPMELNINVPLDTKSFEPDLNGLIKHSN